MVRIQRVRENARWCANISHHAARAVGSRYGFLGGACRATPEREAKAFTYEQARWCCHKKHGVAAGVPMNPYLG